MTEYNVLLSASYQVPVLYFILGKTPPDGPQGIEAVYHYLVPDQSMAALKAKTMENISTGVGWTAASNEPD